MMNNVWMLNCWLAVAAGNPASRAATKPAGERREGRPLTEDTTSVIPTTPWQGRVSHYSLLYMIKPEAQKG